MARYIPRTVNGQIKLVEVRGGLLKTDWKNKPWYEQTYRGYYDLECAGKFRPTSWSKEAIKRIWTERIERGS